jgi:hypothetical protein
MPKVESMSNSPTSAPGAGMNERNTTVTTVSSDHRTRVKQFYFT